MSSWIETARQALAMFRKGLTPVEIKVKLDQRYSLDVRKMIVAADDEERFLGFALTKDEVTLIRNVGKAQLSAIQRGDTCSPKLKYCGQMFWAKGKAERIARKRLDKHRKGEDPSKCPGTGLGLLNAYNGYVCLRPAGWSLWHALEAAEVGQ